MSTEEHITRIVDRLRRDHPDPEIRQELYDDDAKLTDYVRTLMNGFDVDESTLGSIAKAVVDAEDGQRGNDG